ncbi:MAG: transposase [Telmatospirillum sp.]|nr:transposase [Telmatospirillum sp.]
MARIEVISGMERRRRWSAEEKRRLVSMAFAPGAVVSAVARREDVHPNQLYRWRQELRLLSPAFAEVVVAEGFTAPVPSITSVVQDMTMIEIVMADRTSLRLPSAISPDLAAAVIGALVRR